MTVVWDVAPCSLAEIDNPDDGGRKHLWNVGQFLRDYTTEHSSPSSYSPPREREMSQMLE
jgi:hypothetical protein